MLSLLIGPLRCVLSLLSSESGTGVPTVALFTLRTITHTTLLDTLTTSLPYLHNEQASEATMQIATHSHSHISDPASAGTGPPPSYYLARSEML